MATERVGDMSMQELRKFVEAIVEEKNQQKVRISTRPESKRSVKEILDSIDQHRWTPPPGSKSSLEFLREDRDA